MSQLLQQPVVASILLRFLRFRPLIATLPTAEMHSTTAGAGGELRQGVPAGQDTYLVLAMDTTGDDLRRVSDVLAALDSLT